MARIERDTLVTPTIYLAVIFSALSIVAAIIGLASPPAMRIAAGAIFVLASFYFISADPERAVSPKWLAPLFVLIGIVFTISGARLYVPHRYLPYFETIASLGFITIALLVWLLVGICVLNKIPKCTKPLVVELDNEKSRIAETSENDPRKGDGD